MTSIGQTQLETALGALGELLMARGLHYEVVLIGGDRRRREADAADAETTPRRDP